jgi:outer membrane protein assembly factor BamB
MPRLLIPIVMLMTAAAFAGPWTHFRGPAGTGVSDEKGLPVQWGSDAITWKAPLPDGGNSAPIVWGDRVFVTCAENKGKLRHTICLNRADGKQLWKRTVSYDLEEPTHNTNPYCSSTPATDGQVVIVWQGSAGLFAYDLEGNERWKRDLGKFTHIWGNASSPVIDGDEVLLSAGPGLRHVLYCLSKADGKTVWEHEQPAAQIKEPGQFKGSWSTPVIHTIGGKKQIILSLPQEIIGFDRRTGERIWWCKGLGDLVYTSPLIGDGFIVGMSGYGGPAIGMREPGGEDTGDLTATHRLWRHEKAPQRIGSGVIAGGHVYIMNDPGTIFCINAKTGEQVWARGEKPGAGTWSSMLLADGKLWITTNAGEMVILKPDPEYEVIAINKLREKTLATPAFSDGQIFVRGYQNLYCIGTRQQQN